ncbi:MAG TPA: helix-hairpin-helix domain-containing protein, partial [Nitrososphaeraceae archaeon]|nr:helix-hairpin-helix domain-containing protein [Nitrososphaeraceae archaeon]
MTDKKAWVPDSESNSVTNDVTSHNPTSSTPSTVVAAVDLEIQDIEGIGPTTARKLKEAGIVSVMDLAV